MSGPSPALIDELRRTGCEVLADRLRRGLYATDASIYQQMPLAVCVPRQIDDISKILRVAREHRVPVLPRGGGTSLAGQTVNEAVVIDFTRHLDRIERIDPDSRTAHVQPGVIRDRLNRELKSHGLMFAPETSTSNRAAIGGMIANNSSGMMSLRYGRTSEHVQRLRALLADGTEVEFGPTAEEPRSEREGGIRNALLDLAQSNRDLIESRWPRTMRRVGGYALDELLQPEPNFARFLCGSEGTLALILSAELNLVPPPASILAVAAHFDTLEQALRALPSIVARNPLSAELMDGPLLQLSRRNPSTAGQCGFIHGDPGAILVIEADGDNRDEAQASLDAIADVVRAQSGLDHLHFTAGDRERQAIHDVRRKGLGVMTRVPSDTKPISFIEDAAVPLEHLAEYIAAMQRLCDELNVPTITYGHASVGVLHFKPSLNLRDPGDLVKLDRISTEAVGLVRRFGGSWSGEHGDGIIRGAKNPLFWGEEMIALFREVKHIFDPEGLLNPGRIIDTPPLIENLRIGPDYQVTPRKYHFHYRAEGGFHSAVEMCNGVGACRKIGEGTMCPSYMATRDEEHTTRGRANALRLAMSGQISPNALTSDELMAVLDLCLECKACATECPSGVDMAKMKSEVLAARHAERGSTLRERMFAGMPRTARLVAGPLAYLVNPLQRLFEPLLKPTLGIAPQRHLPRFATEKFSEWFIARIPFRGNFQEALRDWENGDTTFPPQDIPHRAPEGRERVAPGEARSAEPGVINRKYDPAGAGSCDKSARTVTAGNVRREVAIFADTYTECFDPDIGRWFTRTLEHLGCRVTLARAGCCQRPRISKGFLAQAKRHGLKTLQHLDEFARRGVPIVVLEPSCLSALRDDLPDLIDDEALGKRVASVLTTPEALLVSLLEEQSVEHPRLDREFLLHGHCHQKALDGTDDVKRALALCGASVDEIDSGCCGMAGSFGYEAEHFDLSQTIAEDRLLTAIRNAPPETVIIASGFSCRHQISDLAGRRPVHFVEAIGRVLLGEW